MRKVVNSSEVAHLWAHQTQSEARNAGGTLWFRGKTIYSYGEHFPIACFVENGQGEQAVLFTTRTYSLTTAMHMGLVRSAMRHISPVFHVPLESHRWMRDEQSHSDYLASYRERITEKQNAVARARKESTREYAFHSLAGLVDEANRFAEFFSLPDRFEVLQDFDGLRQSLAKVDAEKRKAERERLAAIARESAEKVERWQAGERVELPYNLERVYLRIEGDELVTSRGARVPVSHAKRVLAFIRACKASGTAYQRNGHTIHIGHYAVDSIDVEGNVKAGCHRVEWAEIERIAGELEQAR